MITRSRGFTLLEVLLSVAVIAVLTGIAAPIYQSFQVRNDLDLAATTIAQTLRRAQALAQAVEGDSAWGVYTQLGSITLFKGSNYAGRDIALDEIFAVPESIAPSGALEISFAKFSGLPLTTGTITLVSSANEERNVAVNAKGTVSY